MPAVAAVAAVGWGAASAATIFAAVAQVGLALTVVGAVTGNETLTKVGGVLGLVGGVGGLATGLASGAATAGAELGAEAAVDAAAETGLNSGGFYGPEAAGAYTTAGDSVAGAAAASVDQAAASAVGGQAAPVANSATSSSATSSVGEIGADGLTAAESTFPTVGAPETPLGATAPTAPVEPGMSGVLNPLNNTPAKGGWLSEVLGGLPGNDSGVWELAKLGGGMLTGGEKTRLAEEELARKQEQLDYEKLMAERANANANAQPSLRNFRYTPNPNLFLKPPQPVKQFTGIVNSK